MTHAAMLERFAPHTVRSSNGRDSNVQSIRRGAFEWVSKNGFPTRKDEAWKYTQLKPILDVPFVPAEPPGQSLFSVDEIDALAGCVDGIRLVFINGYIAPSLSSGLELANGARVTTLSGALAQDPERRLEPVIGRPFRERPNAFTALNVALAEDGAVVEIPADTTMEAPIHLVFASSAGSTPLASHARTIVRAGPRSRATLVETHVGKAGDVYLSNVVTELLIEEDAAIEHYKVQHESEAAFHVALLDARLHRSSQLAAHSVAIGASIARHEVRARLLEERSLVTLNGLYMPFGSQHLDNPTTIEHLSPSCTSRALYKGVIDEHGRGVFDGQVIVHPGAMGTDAHQMNANLLLSHDAEVDTRPRLEIFADDVKCAHGAAVGQLDENQLLYLRSRGIPRSTARSVLIKGFVQELLDLVRLDSLRSHVEGLVGSRMPATEVQA